ncbi:tetratricopeptide repeat protein [Winogradskyella sp.]|uniref:tetratricopeptide repeat protein n=1 Tax=Winogradskyella sp. TaxID=1883156 RepID=UPI0026359AA7|nr:tetratricopeptide repeat protein [Winogradskyella sp.]
MKSKASILVLIVFTLLVSCANSVEYSETFKKETSGKYLYNSDELILVYYEANKLRLNWKGGKIAPVALEENEFFVPDMYKKFRFVMHPETQKRYLSIVDENNQEKITYDYIKVTDDYKTPSQYLEEGDYELALAGYLEIKKQDSTSSYINEWDFNSKGYQHMRKKEYDKAIGVLELNAKLHPNSSNVYDSLGEAYLKNGDSLQAYTNYKIALEMNPENKRAKRYLEAYTPKAVMEKE